MKLFKFLFLTTLSICLFTACDDNDSTLSNQKEILKFSIQSIDGTINQINQKIEISLLSNTDVKTLSPIVLVSDNATVNPKSGELVDFTEPIEYTVTAEDQSVKKYTVTVIMTDFETTITEVSTTSLDLRETFTITGKFAKEGNTVELTDKDNKATSLSIESENATSIVAKTPADMKEGKYSLVVTSNEIAATYDTKINITYQVRPVILGLNKSIYEYREGNIVLTGTNLKSAEAATTIYFKRKDAPSYYIYGEAKVNEEGTTITTVNNSSFELGKHEVYVKVNGRSSNEVEFEIVDSSYPAPSITSVSNTNPSDTDIITITGTNFPDKNNVSVSTYLELYDEYKYWGDFDVLSATPTSLTFKLNERLKGKKIKLKVRVSKKFSNYSEIITVK